MDFPKQTGLRLAAIVGLSGENDVERALLLELATGESPALRTEALRSLRGAELSNDVREQLASIARSASQDAALAACVLGEGELELRPARTDIEAWAKLVEGPGDPEAGERIFFHPHGAGCYRCHRLAGRGGIAGPDLSNLNAQADQRRVLESILDPSKEIAPQFVAWTILCSDGKVLTAMMVEQDATGIDTYAGSEGHIIQLERSTIESREPHAKSIMPDNLVDSLTIQELRDLLALLTSRPLETGKPSGEGRP